MFSVVKSFFFPPKFDVIEKSDATIENLGHIADFKKKPIPSQPHRFYADHKEGLKYVTQCEKRLKPYQESLEKELVWLNASTSEEQYKLRYKKVLEAQSRLDEATSKVLDVLTPPEPHSQGKGGAWDQMTGIAAIPLTQANHFLKNLTKANEKNQNYLNHPSRLLEKVPTVTPLVTEEARTKLSETQKQINSEFKSVSARYLISFSIYFLGICSIRKGSAENH